MSDELDAENQEPRPSIDRWPKEKDGRPYLPWQREIAELHFEISQLEAAGAPKEKIYELIQKIDELQVLQEKHLKSL
ncbi:MAG: hypothetical protein WDO13_06215 [Verrucomicrobiota bacterium]